MWTREPHRNVLSTQEYRPAQRKREIKELIDLRRRNVGETRGGKAIPTYFPPFSLNIQKADLASYVSWTEERRKEVGEISRAKPSIDWKMAETTSIDRKNVHKSTCKSANRQWPSDHLQHQNSRQQVQTSPQRVISKSTLT